MDKIDTGSKELDAIMEHMRTTILAREEKEKNKSLVPQFQISVQLPLWPEPVRTAPNSFLRSALFAAIQGKGRRYMKKELLAAQKGVSVHFTGMQLDQSDLDVWEQAIHIARNHPLGNVCHFRGNAFLKSIGRPKRSIRL